MMKYQVDLPPGITNLDQVIRTIEYSEDERVGITFFEEPIKLDINLQYSVFKKFQFTNNMSWDLDLLVYTNVPAYVMITNEGQRLQIPVGQTRDITLKLKTPQTPCEVDCYLVLFDQSEEGLDEEKNPTVVELYKFSIINYKNINEESFD